MNGLFLIDSESAVDADLSRLSGEEDSQSNDTQWVTLTIDAIDSEAGTVTASHGPVAAWDWPAMTIFSWRANFLFSIAFSPSQINSATCAHIHCRIMVGPSYSCVSFKSHSKSLQP